MKVKVYKCYEVTVQDDEGNTIESRYIYNCTQKEALAHGKQMKYELLKKELERLNVIEKVFDGTIKIVKGGER